MLGGLLWSRQGASQTSLWRLGDLLLFVAKKNKIDKCLNACKKFNPVILDKTKNSAVIQITALRREIDKMSIKLKSLGLISASRTGAVAMTRGDKVFN